MTEGEPAAPQISSRLQFTFKPPADVNLAALDGWLAGILQVGIDPVNAAAPALERNPRDLVQWLWRVMLLARTLLQVSRVPVFDAPEIQDIQPDPANPGALRATVRFPVLEVIRVRSYTTALTGSVRLCHWAGARAMDDESLKAFFQLIDREVISPLQGMVPGGKGTVPTLRVAHALGIPFAHLGSGIYLLGWGSRGRRLDRSTTEGDTALGARISQNKVDTTRLLAMAGLPAPTHQVVGTAAEAADAARSLGWPVVVKPADRDRGLGVTVDVFDEATLAVAFREAQELAKNRMVIVERQAPGVCHRLFIAGGSLLYGVKRLPMSVRGDGRRTVDKLVTDEARSDMRKPPWLRSGIQPMDAIAAECIRKAGWDASSVPPDGTWVPLRRIESTEWGGIDEEVTQAVHPDNLDICLRAAAILGLEIAGVDIITEDIARSWRETGAIINEVNYSPLLGGGEISRSHIPEFLRRLLGDEGGRIPVEIFIGGKRALAEAQARKAALAAQGLRAFLTTQDQTIDAAGRDLHMTFSSVRQRVQALLLDRDVDALLAVVSRDEAGARGLPLPVRNVRTFDEPNS